MLDEMIQKLPSNAFFDFLKENYKAIFEFLGKVLRAFHVDVDMLEK